MKQVLIQHGRVVVDRVPVPAVEPGTLLVRVAHSCISAGTELSGVRHAATPLWKRALRRPGAVWKAVGMAATQGVAHAAQVIQGKLGAGQPTGYSAAGTIVEVGAGVDDLAVGDRVACAGAQCAHHAEFIRPPRNLVVRIPDGLDTASASTVTLGAIALQGVRRAAPTLGETFVVLGLGLIGQLTVQLLKANGCRVVGADLDSHRVAVAQALGLDASLSADADEQADEVCRITDGIGADGVIVTAASRSDAIVSSAFRMCRKKGRVVVVGDVGLNLDRADMYAKELDFFISTSYGPGRYDRRYEQEGLDYPIGYVRWTENRNMGEYVRLLAEGRITVAPLAAATFPIERAPEAYRALEGGEGPRPLMVLLSYPREQPAAGPVRVVPCPTARPGRPDAVRLALIGAGSFARGVHLPNVQSLAKQVTLHAVCSRTGHDAVAVARQHQARYATSDYQAVLNDPDVDAVLIATRHDSHASLALAALEAGKHVLVEKPLALSREELDSIVAFYASHPANGGAPLLLTGYNRRFSPHAVRIRQAVAGRTNPMIVNYRMNAGYIPLDSWVHGPQGGGRNLGEACHIYDFFIFVCGCRASAVETCAIRPATGYYSGQDNFVATVSFEDGSVATLTYTALGAGTFPKEQCDVFVDGKVCTLDDYRTTTIHRGGRRSVSRIVDKGHRAELQEFVRAIREGGPWPIPLWQQIEASEISFRVEQKLGSDLRVENAGPARQSGSTAAAA